MARKRGDKPYMQTTMKEVAQGEFNDGTTGSLFPLNTDASREKVEAEKLAQTYWTDHEEDIIEYNKNLNVLDPKYAGLEPGSGIIVRCFHIQTKQTKNGIWLTPEIPMKEMTQNGIGIRETKNSPWKLMRKAIVVAVPKSMQNTYKAGDIVELDRNSITAIKPSIDHPPHLERGFTISDWYGYEPPKDPKNEHFGYLRVDFNEIVAKISKK